MELERIGPYRIIRLLGQGGMGAVYEGLHEAIERRVAIKVLHAELARRADIATRFFNEAKAVNRIDHPGLVQVSDYGQLPDGMAYIVMEYLKGETLGQRLKRVSGRLPTTDVIRLGRQICSALAAAHDKDIVHRDLKPDNIMIVPNADVPGGEQIKILDFGIAKVAESESGISEAHTRADAMLGTPKYMSPEQCKGGGGVDAKSDVYSLGVIFYELLAGRAPFLGSAHGELIVQHMMQAPEPLSAFALPGTPEPLLSLVGRMLAKDKGLRPSMRQVVGELDNLGGYMSGVVSTSSLPNISLSPSLGPQTPIPTPNSLPGHQSLRSLPGYAGPPSLPSAPGVVAAGSYPPSPTLGTAAGQVPLTTRPRWQFAVALGSVVGAIAVGLLLVMSLSKPTPQPVAPPPPRPAMPKSEPPPVVKVVHYTVDSQPTGAAVVRLRDGQLLGQTPLSLTSPLNSVPEQLRVSLPGYVEESVAIDLRQDSEQKLELRRKGGRDSKRSKNPKSDTHAKGYVHGDLTVVD